MERRLFFTSIITSIISFFGLGYFNIQLHAKKILPNDSRKVNYSIFSDSWPNKPHLSFNFVTEIIDSVDFPPEWKNPSPDTGKLGLGEIRIRLDGIHKPELGKSFKNTKVCFS